MGADWSTEEGSAGVFERVLLGNLPGYEDAAEDFRVYERCSRPAS